MTDFTIREIQDLRELATEPAPRAEPAPETVKTSGEALLTEAHAMIARLKELGY
jgi:hypothetical protein